MAVPASSEMSDMNTTRELENFGRNVQFTPQGYYEPRTEQEVLEILNRHAGRKIRVIGKLHSWSGVCITQGVVLSLKHFRDVQVVDDSGPGSHAWVGAGIPIKQLIVELARYGRTLPSLGLITEQTIVGAISTGTHGSGRQCLSHFAEGFRMARYDASSGKAIIDEIDSGDALRAAQCGLGNLGVVLSVKMRCRNPYQVEEFWHPYATLAQVLKKQDEYPLQQFFLLPWQWQYLAQHRRETPAATSGPEWLYRIYFFLCIDILLHSVLALLAKLSLFRAIIPVTFRGVLARSVIKNWKVVGDSNRMLIMEQELFRHIETELFVQARHLPQALELVRSSLEWADGNSMSSSKKRVSPDSLGPQLDLPELANRLGLQSELDAARGVHCHHFPICVRRILPDNTLLSMTSGGGEDWYSISLISYARVHQREGFLAVVRFIAKAMAQLYHARPHWGKYIPLTTQELISLYPEFSKYRDICTMLDSEGRFRNEWFEQLFKQSTSAEN